MRKLISAFDLAFAFLFFVIAGISLIGTPSQYADRLREPEDFYGLLFIFILTIMIALVFLLVGLRVLRKQRYSWRATPILWIASITTSLMLLTLALLDIIGPNDPGTFGFRMLFVPAVAILCSVLYSVVYSKHADALNRE